MASDSDSNENGTESNDLFSHDSQSQKYICADSLSAENYFLTNGSDNSITSDVNPSDKNKLHMESKADKGSENSTGIQKVKDTYVLNKSSPRSVDNITLSSKNDHASFVEKDDFLSSGAAISDRRDNPCPSENSSVSSIQEIKKEDTKIKLLRIVSNQFKGSPTHNGVQFREREGTNQDVFQLWELFHSNNYEVKIYDNKTVNNIRDLILMESPSLKLDQTVGLYVIVILSHGFNGGVYGSDCKKLSFRQIIAAMNMNKWLIGVTKVVFIQACQDNEKNVIYPFSVLRYLTDCLATDCLAKKSDVLISVAAMPGQSAYLRNYFGSPYIEHLCRLIREYGEKEPLQVILKRLEKYFSEISIKIEPNTLKQIPTTLGSSKYIWI
ncbi:caspase-3 [Hydra vulgaris]|uniref:caspase-3 n=1 Tax=Hydra vulgaris TaxID=6087 RepID=UPI00064119E3|nr:caspase-3 [Hydra vulgaris]